MQAYDPPPTADETDGLTPEQAQAALNALHAACGADPGHPYFDGSHPQHADFVKFSTRLHTLIVTAQVEEQESRAAQALEDARAETGGLTPAGCLARGKALLATPGYLAGTMPQAERAKLKKEIDALYLVGSQPEASTPAKTPVTDAPDGALDDDDDLDAAPLEEESDDDLS